MNTTVILVFCADRQKPYLAAVVGDICMGLLLKSLPFYVQLVTVLSLNEASCLHGFGSCTTHLLTVQIKQTPARSFGNEWVGVVLLVWVVKRHKQPMKSQLWLFWDVRKSDKMFCACFVLHLKRVKGLGWDQPFKCRKSWDFRISRLGAIIFCEWEWKEEL